MSVTMETVIGYDSAIVTDDLRDDRVELRAQDDTELVARAQHGSIEAFEVLVRRYRPTSSASEASTT